MEIVIKKVFFINNVRFLSDITTKNIIFCLNSVETQNRILLKTNIWRLSAF